MSNCALNWAFDAPLRGSLKSVLVALANYANDDQKCFPSITRLAMSSGLSRRAVITTIVQLEALGYIETEKKFRSATYYRITMKTEQSGELGSPRKGDDLVNSLHQRTRPKNPNLVNWVHSSGELGSPQPLLTTERKKEKSTPIVPKSAFLTWWAIYPRKVARGAAEKAWDKAVKRATVADIMAATANYVWPDDPQFVPHGATWLNQDRWLDEPPKPKPPPLTVDQKIMRAVGLFDDDEIPPQEMRMLQ